jgi:hypothetical protein
MPRPLQVIAAFLFLLFHYGKGMAQVDSLFSRFSLLQIEYDTNYIQKGTSNWDAHVFLQAKNNSFSSTDRSENKSVYFDPLTNLTLGFGGSYKNLVMDVGFPIQNNKGDSEHASGIDLTTSLYVAQHAADLGFRRFKGYYVSGYDSVKDELSSVFRSDIATASLHLNYLYNFNFRRYSFNASFVGRETQRRSAGAPLAGLFFSYHDLHANESIIPPDFDIPDNSSARISEANLWTLGVIGGYAYTFVLPSHFFLTLSLAPGFALTTGEAKADAYFDVGEPINVSFKLLSKNAFGYSNRRFYGYLSGTSDRSWLKLTADDGIKNNMSKWKLLVGYVIK